MPRAIIIGGSVGGLFAANMLLRQGWHVEIHERAALTAERIVEFGRRPAEGQPPGF